MLRTLLVSLCLSLPQVALACGTADDTCKIAGGDYLIERPQNPIGAIVFLHGYGGSANGTMKNARLRNDVLARGYAFVAPNGSPSAVAPGRRSWSFHPEFRKARDEAEFFSNLFDDLAETHGIPRDRVLLGGFSAGGFMVSYLACSNPEIASAYVPVSGGFWRPHPEACDGPVRLFHTHGWTDTVVPLEGRFLRNGTVAQGDIFHGMDIWRHSNKCDAMRADHFEVSGAFWRRSWDRCLPGSALEFALFPGGHTVPSGWADMVLDWYEALPVQAAR